MQKPPYLHWFWDFDGTLYDSYPRVVRAFQKGLRAKGIAVPDYEVLKLVKVTLGHAARHYAQGIYADELLAMYALHAEAEGPATLLPYPDVAQVLAVIADAGGRNYLYTHRDQSGVKALERDRLWQYFTDAVTSNDAFAHKPSPDALKHMISKHGLDKRACAMVGDRSIDLDAARNASIDGVLFDPDGFYPKYPAKYRYTSYQQMLDDLKT
jgi:HAD superfamily hydrolase (TIGR01549 family)